MSTREERGRDVVRQSGLTSVAAGLAIVSGLVLDVAIGMRFGATASTDAFFFAAGIALGLVAVVMVGANQALVPTISTWLQRRGEAETWRLCSVLACAALVGGAILVVVVDLLAWPLMRGLALGFEPWQVELAAGSLRILMPIVPLVAVAEVLRALLNARYSFFAPAAMHVVMNAVAAAIVIGLAGPLSVVAWAFVAGALAQAVFMLIMAVREGFRPHLTLAVRNPDP